jgi:hypothetical protein
VTRRRSLLVGIGVVALYLLALSFTTALRHDDARPLYDGFVPPPTYRFVDPPPFFAADNVEPEPTSTTIALRVDGSEPAGIATPDGQFVVSLARGAIAPAPGATSIAVRITPVAASTLAPVPNDLRANGNAYRVDMRYEPAGGTVTRFAKPGTLLLELPELGSTLFVSADATTWREQPAQPISPRQLSLSATFAAPGYYVAATNLPVLAPQPGRSQSTGVVLGIVVAIGAFVLFLAVYFLVVRKRRDAQ